MKSLVNIFRFLIGLLRDYAVNYSTPNKKGIEEMISLKKILTMESSVVETNRSKYLEEINRCNEIIDLYAEVWDYLKDKDFDTHTSEGASKAIVWRFSCSIPSDALWCLNSAIRGQVGVAGALLRLLIEEAYCLMYYAKFPKEALRHVVESPGKDKADFSKKLDALGISSSHSLREFYGQISNLYAHANALLRPEFVVNDDEASVKVAPGPRYLEITIPFFTEYIISCLAIALGALIAETFPELHLAPNNWSGRVTKLYDEIFHAIDDE